MAGKQVAPNLKEDKYDNAVKVDPRLQNVHKKMEGLFVKGSWALAKCRKCTLSRQIAIGWMLNLQELRPLEMRRG